MTLPESLFIFGFTKKYNYEEKPTASDLLDCNRVKETKGLRDFGTTWLL